MGDVVYQSGAGRLFWFNQYTFIITPQKTCFGPYPGAIKMDVSKLL